MPKYASWCWWWFQQSVATRSPRSSPALRRATASCRARRSVSRWFERWKLLSWRRVTISPSPKNVSARRSTCVNVSGKSIIRPSIPPILLREERVCDLETEVGGTPAETLEPDCALVEPVQWMLPGEADPAVHLDRALAPNDRSLGGERLRRGGCERRALVLLRDAPRGPVDERARELDVGVRLREWVGDGLVRADRLTELLARLRVLDAEVERALRDAERLSGRSRAEAWRFLDGPQRACRVNRCGVAVARQRRNVCQVEARVADVPQLLEEQCLLDEAESRLRDVEPAEFLELAPAVVLRLPVPVERETVGEPS